VLKFRGWWHLKLVERLHDPILKFPIVIVILVMIHVPIVIVILVMMHVLIVIVVLMVVIWILILISFDPIECI
jgi:hypothetical protein